MSTYRENKKLPRLTLQKDYHKTYEWKDILQAEESNNFKNGFLPVSAFSTNLIQNFTEVIKEDAIFEVFLPQYENNSQQKEVRWFAKIIKVCGYRVLARYIGAENDSSEDFWINILSDDVKYVGSGGDKDPEQQKILYSPPPFLMNKHQERLRDFLSVDVDKKLKKKLCLGKEYEKNKQNLFNSKFKINQRLELLNYNDSREIRVARIQTICGRRLNVSITKGDYDGDWSSDDRQLKHKLSESEYWIDQDSFFIFPVGWASYNDFGLNVKPEYKKHTEAIAKSIENNQKVQYNSKDVSPEFFSKPSINSEDWAKVKVGQKCELIDPLAQQFHDLKVASVLKILKSEGYFLIGMDGPDAEEESIPLHVTSPFLFPVGYAEKYNLNLVPPPDRESFNWETYLKETESEPLPVNLFKTNPSKERLNSLKVGAKLEAADMCENQFICPGTVKTVHGRILNVHFDGWEDDYDELYDIESHDIFPVGWCEAHGYVLQRPKS